MPHAGLEAAIEEARAALDAGSLPIGAAVVCGERVLGRGRNRIHSKHDYGWHAEIEALRAAGPEIYTVGYEQSVELYTTVEPCVMCLATSLTCLVQRIVYVLPDRGGGALSSLDLLIERHLPDRKRPEVERVDDPRALELLDAYYRRLGRPNEFAPEAD